MSDYAGSLSSRSSSSSSSSFSSSSSGSSPRSRHSSRSSLSRRSGSMHSARSGSAYPQESMSAPVQTQYYQQPAPAPPSGFLPSYGLEQQQQDAYTRGPSAVEPVRPRSKPSSRSSSRPVSWLARMASYDSDHDYPAYRRDPISNRLSGHISFKQRGVVHEKWHHDRYGVVNTNSTFTSGPVPSNMLRKLRAFQPKPAAADTYIRIPVDANGNPAKQGPWAKHGDKIKETAKSKGPKIGKGLVKAGPKVFEFLGDLGGEE